MQYRGGERSECWVACLSNEQSEQGTVLGEGFFWGGGLRGGAAGSVAGVLGGGAIGWGSGLSCSWYPSACVLIRPLLLVYLMFPAPPFRSQYSVLINRGHLWVKKSQKLFFQNQQKKNCLSKLIFAIF